MKTFFPDIYGFARLVENGDFRAGVLVMIRNVVPDLLWCSFYRQPVFGPSLRVGNRANCSVQYN